VKTALLVNVPDYGFCKRRFLNCREHVLSQEEELRADRHARFEGGVGLMQMFLGVLGLLQNFYYGR
jgi:hypothetical protein